MRKLVLFIKKADVIECPPYLRGISTRQRRETGLKSHYMTS